MAILLLLTGVGCSTAMTGGGDLVPSPAPRAVDNLVFYEANFQTLGGADRFAALEGRLDDIAALSANVLWLMPIYPIGQLNGVGSPYSVRDYQAVNPDFGTLDGLKALVNEAHRRNIAVVLDWVANHTSWDNAWVTAHPDWYTHDSQGHIISPAGFNWTDVADLNYASAGLRSAMTAAMEFWVDQVGIDGFRCDAADFVPDDFWAQALAAVDTHAGRHLIWLAEGGNTSLYRDGFQLLYGWNFCDGLQKIYQGTTAPTALAGVQANEESGLGPDQGRLRYTTNHDKAAWEGSPVTLFGSQDAALSAFAAAAFSGGVPLVYGTQEVGYPVKVPFFAGSNLNIDWTANSDILSRYRQILALRASSEAARSGTKTDLSTASVLAFTRQSPTETLAFVSVPGAAARDFTLPSSPGEWAEQPNGPALAAGQTVTIPGRGYRVFLSKR